MRAGSVLGPAELGVLASMNIPRPRVVRRPRVAIAGTGDELTDPGKPLGPGAIRDSNGPALGGAVHRAGGELVARVRVGDDLDATVAVLGAALRDVDMLITTGGVSVGPHDHVRPALARLGYREVFAGVRLKPGRPTTFAVGDDGTLVFALPGNPVSALMAFRLFVVPAIDAMLGRSGEHHPVKATADEALEGSVGRTTVIRCRTTMQDDGWHVRPDEVPGTRTSSRRCSASTRSRSSPSTATASRPASRSRSSSSAEPEPRRRPPRPTERGVHKTRC